MDRIKKGVRPLLLCGQFFIKCDRYTTTMHLLLVVVVYVTFPPFFVVVVGGESWSRGIWRQERWWRPCHCNKPCDRSSSIFPFPRRYVCRWLVIDYWKNIKSKAKKVNDIVRHLKGHEWNNIILTDNTQMSSSSSRRQTDRRIKRNGNIREYNKWKKISKWKRTHRAVVIQTVRVDFIKKEKAGRVKMECYARVEKS